MNTKRSANRLWYLAVAAAFGATCRSYETDFPELSNTGGSSAAGSGGSGGGKAGEGGSRAGSSSTSGESGASGASGDGGHAGDPSGGNSGDTTAGRSGSAGSSSGGMSGDGASGEGGGGSGPTDTAEPGILGAVRVLVDGMPKCGGSLLNNDWVLTADQCVSDMVDRTSLEVGFGMDAENFQQTRGVLEIQRFPGNDGTVGRRGRDLLLLGLDRPFEIEGRTSGYHRPVWTRSPEVTLAPHVCVGWDLLVSDQSPTNKLHEETLLPVTFDLQTTNGSRPSGSRLWWLNVSGDPQQGVLPMQADVGSACFYMTSGAIYQHTVHSGNPELRRNSTTPNDGRDAYSSALGETVTQQWLNSVMFDSVVEELELAGDPAVCSLQADRIELFGLKADSRLGWFTWDGAFTERASFPAPSGTTFRAESPGAYCTKAGTIELFAVGLDGRLYWQRMTSSEEWNDDWALVDEARSAIDSGVSVAGVLPDHFMVFARAASGELRYAEFERGWKPTWVDLGGMLMGTPAAIIVQEHRADVYIRDLATGDLRMRWAHQNTWQPWAPMQGPPSSDATAVSFHPLNIDVITRSTSNTVRHQVLEVGWGEPYSLDITMPAGGNPAAVSRQPGMTDVFLRQQDGKVWHAFWPRKPR